MLTIQKSILNLFKFLMYLIITILFIIISINLFTKASNNRNWNEDQNTLAYADINSNSVFIHNIRNFRYESETEYKKDYYDKKFDLEKIKSVWYIVEPFSGIPGSAHTFLSFEFENQEFVAISVEIRKEKNESFNPIKGLFNQYEIMYVIADENDVIKLRSNFRKDLVYLYPILTTKEKAKEIFLDMLNRANKLKENPEFYNTITNTCTTNIVKHVNKITQNKIPLFNPEVIFPANSDLLAYKLGLIDSSLPFEDTRKKHLINDKAIKYANDPDFSTKIRE